MVDERIITAIEPGEARFRLLVARHRQDSLRILAHVEVASRGIERGRVVDLYGTAEAIYAAVRAAERDLGFPLDNTVLCVPAQAILALHSHGTVEPSGAGRTVTERDGDRVLSRAQPHLPEGRRRLLHFLPTHYMLDDVVYEDLPLHTRGSELTVSTCALAGETATTDTLAEAAHMAGVEVTDLVAMPLASSLGVLTEGERHLGAVLLEIGASSTTIALIRQGRLMDATTVPVGGHHLTNDLSIGLSLPVDVAERLKTSQGSISFDPTGPAEISVSCPDGTSVTVSRVAAISLLRDRAQEILGLAHRRLATAGYGQVPPGGIVLTGGSAHLTGIGQLAHEVFGVPVRIGRPRGMESISSAIQDPAWAASVGAVLWEAALLRSAERAASGANGALPRRMARRALRWFSTRGKKIDASEVTHGTTATKSKAAPAAEAIGAAGSRSHGREE